MLCRKCGRDADAKHFHLGMCQACYNYFHFGGTENPIPNHGEIEYDHRGYTVLN